MKRWLIIGGAVILLAVIVIANLNRSSGPEVEARLSAASRGDVTATISAPGRVRAVASVDISAEVPGRVVELRVAEGDSVVAGDVLLQLDDTTYRSRVAQADAALASARAAYQLGQARLDRFDKDRERAEALFAKGLASQERLDNAISDAAVQKAETESRRQDVQRALAARAEAQDNLEKTVYKAPVSGIVARLNIERGENVIVGTMNNPGTVILTIADLGLMEVEAEVDETDVVTVRVGQPATITVDAIPDTTFAGHVVTVGHSGLRGGTGAADEVINFEVKVRFDSFDARLRPGMTADVEVETEVRRGVLTVPIQALVARSRGTLERDRKAAERRAAGKKGTDEDDADSTDTGDDEARRKWERELIEGVYIVRDGVAVFVEVSAGIADASRIEVIGDLDEGVEMVSGPFKVLRDLKEGTKIKATQGGSDAS